VDHESGEAEQLLEEGYALFFKHILDAPLLSLELFVAMQSTTDVD